MRTTVAVLMVLAVLVSVFLPALEAAAIRSKQQLGGRRPAARRPAALRQQIRRGRQEDPAAPSAPPAEGGDVPTWCNPEDPMGAWLLFKVYHTHIIHSAIIIIKLMI